MSIENVSEVKTQIQSIKTSGDTGSRDGRIEILKQVSDLGKELLDALNEKDKNLVKIESEYGDVADEFAALEKEMDAATAEAEAVTTNLEDVNARIAELEEKLNTDGELSEDDQADLEYYYQLRANAQQEAEGTNGNLEDVSGKMEGAGAKIEKYREILNDITSTMEDFGQAGEDVKQAAHDVGRPAMADNLEKDGGALKRNESCWGSELWDVLTGGITAVVRESTGGNDTEQAVARAGLRGMGDGGEGTNMTYHDDVNGGYAAEYDVIQYGIGGELRDLTAKTWSYGKTTITAADDMNTRAGNIDLDANNTESDIDSDTKEAENKKIDL